MFLFYSKESFSPLDIGGKSALSAWYDFTSSAYLTLLSTAITQALDRSGNGNHTAEQGTGTLRPTFTSNQKNGLPAAVFDGGDSLTLPAALNSIPNGDNTTFVVSTTSIDNSVQRLVSIGTAANGRYNVSFNSSANTIQFANNVNVYTSPVTKTNYNILMGRLSGVNQYVAFNNSTAATNASGAYNSDSDLGTIGSTREISQFLTGGIAEILIYNRSLTAAEILQVNRYFSNKYGITLS